jgi:5S rRNA maturation endonuclease (ribonuclease M5)
MMDLRKAASLLDGDVSGKQIVCPGPNHSRKDRSLSVRFDASAPGGFVVNSSAGDDPIECRDYVCNRLGLEPFKAGAAKKKLLLRKTRFAFCDPATGEIRYHKERKEYDDGSKSIWFEPKGRGGSPPLLYGAERLADLSEGQTVFVVEGEKQVDRLRQLGFVAVSADSGHSSPWRQEYAELLRGLHVILWPDSDAPGEKYIENAVACIKDTAASIKVVRPLGLPNGSKGLDVCDWRGDSQALVRLIETAEPYAPLAAVTAIRFKELAAFCGEYVPLAYAIEPIIRASSLYTLTARTGHGKTAFLVIVSLAIGTGRADVLELEITRGRVAFLTFENPDDVRMRFMIAAYALNIVLDEIGSGIVILDSRAKPEEVLADLAALAEAEPFTLIIVDTFAAFFDGDDTNDATQGGEFMRRIRPLTKLKGNLAVLVAAHPIKNAPEDNLLPYGSSAILNEVDGTTTGLVSLHWQGKLRGLDFEPINFRFENVSSPDVLDAKGRQILLPVMRPCDAQTAGQRETAEANLDLALLNAMIANPNGTQTDRTTAIGRTKGPTNHRLQKLKKLKLVEEWVGKWRLTEKGKKAVNTA